MVTDKAIMAAQTDSCLTAATECRAYFNIGNSALNFYIKVVLTVCLRYNTIFYIKLVAVEMCAGARGLTITNENIFNTF